MKNQKLKKAFTMIELVFIIVIIGILAGVAIPRLSATRDDAIITKARTTVATVRNALAMERQKRILRGEFGEITAVGDSTNVFGNFYTGESGSRVDTGHLVLEYPLKSEPNKKDRWWFDNDKYVFKSILGEVKFKLDGGKFVCVDESSDGCKQLTN